MTPVVSWCIHRYQTVANLPGLPGLLFTQQKKSSWSSKSESLIFLQNKCLKLDMNKSCISSYVVYH